MVEVCHSWFNRFRKLLVRYEKLERSFVALNHLAAAIIAFRKVPTADRVRQRNKGCMASSSDLPRRLCHDHFLALSGTRIEDDHPYALIRQEIALPS